MEKVAYIRIDNSNNIVCTEYVDGKIDSSLVLPGKDL